mmetsp:Transcript_72259/g.172531  ORF Transcript_72259/g.172531 Transcript_72259/m.172531 type:complete len:222 (-) Transcript_72259:201-866(-)
MSQTRTSERPSTSITALSHLLVPRALPGAAPSCASCARRARTGGRSRTAPCSDSPPGKRRRMAYMPSMREELIPCLEARVIQALRTLHCPRRNRRLQIPSSFHCLNAVEDLGSSASQHVMADVWQRCHGLPSDQARPRTGASMASAPVADLEGAKVLPARSRPDLRHCPPLCRLWQCSSFLNPTPLLRSAERDRSAVLCKCQQVRLAEGSPAVGGLRQALM